MPTLKELRIEARLPVSRLARMAEIDKQTILRAEAGEHIRELTAYAILDVLSKRLGRKIDIDQIDGLDIVARK